MRWLVLYYCAVPRVNYVIRTTPPSLARAYAGEHDKQVLRTLAASFGYTDNTFEIDVVAAQLQLPMRLGGCSLRSSIRNSLATHWGSWCADLPTLHTRVASFTNFFSEAMHRLDLNDSGVNISCFHELYDCKQQLIREGFEDMSSWSDILQNRLSLHRIPKT